MSFYPPVDGDVDGAPAFPLDGSMAERFLWGRRIRIFYPRMPSQARFARPRRPSALSTSLGVMFLLTAVFAISRTGASLVTSITSDMEPVLAHFHGRRLSDQDFR